MAMRKVNNKKPKLKTIINKVSNFVFDLIFPKFCVGCGIEGTWLCNNCKKDILLVESQVCPDCLKISQQGKYCKDCRKKYALKGIMCACYFEEGPTREIIHNFKYNSVTELQGVLGDILYRVFKKSDLLIDLITFAPLHRKRMAQRGYNQSEILTQKLSEKSKIKYQSLLIKKRSTKRQVELTGKLRRKNLTGVFSIIKGINIKNKRILIIDDITTTGATLDECAKVLKSAGAREVWGLVVARG
jgi:ComF family protein